MLPSQLVLGGTPGLRMVHCTLAGSTGYKLVMYLFQGIDLYISATQSASPQSIIGCKRMCLSIILLFNKYHHWLIFTEEKRQGAV